MYVCMYVYIVYELNAGSVCDRHGQVMHAVVITFLIPQLMFIHSYIVIFIL